MKFISTTHKGLVRNENQDSHGNQKSKNGHIFVVCDGLGGLPNGALASSLAVKSILSSFANYDTYSEIMLKRSLDNAHANVQKASNSMIGTTITVLYLENDTARVAWCGDSRIYQFRKHSIEWMSRDHNILHDVLNKGLSKGDVFQNPNAITRFLGRSGNHRSDIYKFHVDPGDAILLCSDGLHGFIQEPDIIHAITGFSIQNASDVLEKQLLSKNIGAPDNFTWYIIEV